jgi:hypothetical protein
MEITQRFTPQQTRLLRLATAAAFVVAAVGSLAILLGLSALQSYRPAIRTASAAQPVTTHLALDILPVKPGGPSENWPAYVASSSLHVPADTLVTVTIRNFDLGDATMPADSPLLKVQGTAGNTASFDGQPYAALGATQVAHTFTIPQLGINVPIPGDAHNNASYLTVTFSFHTGKAGTYVFQCFAPCGTGSSGFEGPMASMAYMRGTLTVSH